MTIQSWNIRTLATALTAIFVVGLSPDSFASGNNRPQARAGNQNRGSSNSSQRTRTSNSRNQTPGLNLPSANQHGTQRDSRGTNPAPALPGIQELSFDNPLGVQINDRFQIVGGNKIMNQFHLTIGINQRDSIRH